jgi:hypothetical protein
MNNDTETVSDLDMTTDEALISALSVKKVGEIELQPFSVMRQFISVDLCYPGPQSLTNQLITVWVCTLTPKDVLKAREDVTAARLAAFNWAEAQGYSLVEYKPIIETYARLNRELTASTNARVVGGADLKKTPGEPPP